MLQKSKQKKEEKSTDDDDDNDDDAKEEEEEDVAEGDGSGDSDGDNSHQAASLHWSVRSIAVAVIVAVMMGTAVLLQIHYRANYKSVPHIIFHDLLAGANGLIDATRVNQKSKIDASIESFYRWGRILNRKTNACTKIQ